jgi:hypothetical protein
MLPFLLWIISLSIMDYFSFYYGLFPFLLWIFSISIMDYFPFYYELFPFLFCMKGIQ